MSIEDAASDGVETASPSASPPRIIDISDQPVIPGLASPTDNPYDPAKDRERMRGWIALILVGTLSACVLLSFIYLFIAIFLLKGFRDLETLKAILELLAGPLVGLVGAATGFYFGEKGK